MGMFLKMQSRKSNGTPQPMTKKHPFEPKTKNTLPPIKDISPDKMTLDQAMLNLTLQPGTRWYSMGQATIFVSPPFAWFGYHLCISCKDRLPTWEEVGRATYALLPPDRTYAMILPIRALYSPSFHLHVHEIKKESDGSIRPLAGNSQPE